MIYVSSIRDFLRGYVLVARLEYLSAELPAVFIPLLIGANSVNAIFSYTLIETIVTFALLFLAGFLINSLTDVDVDRKYKTHVSTGVDIVGRGKLKLIIALHVSIALILALHISMTVQNIWLFAWVLVGTFFGLGYSAKPFHFKVRGAWHVIALTTSAFLVPFSFLYFVTVGRSIDINAIILIIGFSIAHYGIALTNQVGDYTEDRETGLLTPAVRWGIKKTLKLSALFMTVGLLIGIYAFTELMLARGTISYIPNVGIDSRLLATGIVVAALGVGYSVPILGTLALHRIANRSKTILESVSGIKKRMNYPRWQACGACSILIISAMLFTTSIIGSYKNTNVENSVLSISAGQDRIVNTGMIVEFNGMVTPTDMDKNKINYTWVFCDQSNTTVYDYRLKFSYVFSKEGVYPVKFIVKDAVGNNFTDRINVTVMQGFCISSNATWKLNWTDPLKKVDVNVTSTVSNMGINQMDDITLRIDQVGTNNQRNTTRKISLKTNETVTIVTTVADVSAAYYTFSITLSCNSVILDSNTVVAKPLV